MHNLPILLSFFAGEPLRAAGNKGFAQMGSRGQNTEQSLDLMGLLVVLGAMLALALVAWGFTYWQKRRESRVLNSPRALFRELCGTHGLHRADRELLHEIAQWHGIADPVQLFIEPQRFQPGDMHESLDCEAEANELQTRLFAADIVQEKGTRPTGT